MFKSHHELYPTWCTMIARCHRPNATNYYNYGAKGISVCKRWRENFWDFIKDVGERPHGHSLDRFPNIKGDYKPSNVRWATAKQQQETVVRKSQVGRVMSKDHRAKMSKSAELRWQKKGEREKIILAQNAGRKKAKLNQLGV